VVLTAVKGEWGVTRMLQTSVVHINVICGWCWDISHLVCEVVLAGFSKEYLRVRAIRKTMVLSVKGIHIDCGGGRNRCFVVVC